MRAYQDALAALYAELLVPHRNVLRDIPFFPHRSTGGIRSIDRHRTYRQHVAAAFDDPAQNIPHKVRSLGGDRRQYVEKTSYFFRHPDFMQMTERGIHGRVILLHHRITAAAIRFFNRLLDCVDRFLFGKHSADGEEAGLHDRIDAAAHARIAPHGIAVDHVEFQLLGNDLLLNVAWEVVPNFVWSIRAIEQKRGARHGRVQHVQPFQEGKLMASDKVRLVHKVAGANRFRTEPQVRDGHRTGFLRVIHEVALRIVRSVFADDLDRILVRAYRTVCA